MYVCVHDIRSEGSECERRGMEGEGVRERRGVRERERERQGIIILLLFFYRARDGARPRTRKIPENPLAAWLMEIVYAVPVVGGTLRT